MGTFGLGLYQKGGMKKVKKSETSYKQLLTEGPVVSSPSKPLTIVTAIYDLGRENLSEGFKRPYQHYLDRFAELLTSAPSSCSFYVYCSEKDKSFIETFRTPDRNIYLHIKELETFRTWFEFFPRVQEIRKKKSWFSQAGWLAESPQAQLEFYNPLVMSKMFLLNDATYINPFNSEYFLWLDAGITTTVHKGYFSHDRVLEKIIPLLDPFLFLSYPYIGSEEIHGFERPPMHQMAKTDYISYVCRGGLFGGRKHRINSLNGFYYNLLKKSLADGYMGTEESIFTILAHLLPNQMNRFKLEECGMIGYFCEAVKDDRVKFEEPPKPVKVDISYAPSDKSAETSIYVLTYNFPGQFKMLLESFSDQSEFLTETRKICCDNSTENDAASEIERLCESAGFEYIHLPDNKGICGGRKYAAQHFAESPQKFYIFFEDDMLMVKKSSPPCRSGFITYVPDLFNKIHKIMKKESFDFLKLTFTEFYMDNSVAVPWYNVPQEVREKVYPEQPQKLNDVPVPRTRFDTIGIEEGLAYITGQIFFCNWPLLMSQEGNRKVFFNPEYAYPYEQTIMSHAFQETLKGNIKPACLLASTINHDRVFHYDGSLRKEC